MQSPELAMVELSVSLSLLRRHCQNDVSWDHKIFTDEDSSARGLCLGVIRLIQKFKRVHPDQGR